MNFVHVDFLWFLPLVLALYWAVRERKAQNVVLLVASAVFYGWLHPWIVLLLYASALLDWGVGLGIERQPARKTPLLVLSILGNVGILCFFKYNGWFLDQVGPAVAATGLDTTTLRVLMPMGLSFYTFQTMAYSIDIYRGRLKARENLLDYLVFVTFFPQLVAGPVERADNLFPQVEGPRRFDAERVVGGLTLALWGGFKKAVLADTLAPYVDKTMLVDAPSTAMAAAAAFGFTVQVLADFSGYTDMARGVARMFGFELTKNFDHPYTAASPMEFWQRWHMSFSTWLRDYVYLPASFSPWVRRWLTIPGTGHWSPFWHTARALTLTMLASGIWHGSTWNYVLWGLYYALLGTVWAAVQQRIPRKVRKSRNWRPLLVPLFFGFTLVGMYIFREPEPARILALLAQDPLAGSPGQWLAAATLFAMALVVAVPLVAALLIERHLAPRFSAAGWWFPLRTGACALMAVGMFVFFRLNSLDFIYFQF